MANSMGDWITSPWANLIYTMIGSRQQNKATKEYERMLEQRYAQGLEGFQARAQEAMNILRSDPNNKQALATLQSANKRMNSLAFREANQAPQEWYDRGGSFNRSLSSRNASIDRGYDQREADVMSLLDNMGAEDRERIIQAGKEAGAANAARLRTMGMTSTTLNPLEGARRETNRQLEGLDESLRAQKAGAISGLRGDKLSAQEAAQRAREAYDYSFVTGGMGARERAINAALDRYGSGEANLANYYANQGNTALNTYLGTSGDYLNFLAGRNDVPPDGNAWLNLANQFGQNSVQQPKPPSGLSSFFGSAAGGIGSGVGTGLGLAALGGGGASAAASFLPFAFLSDRNAKVIHHTLGEVEEQRIADRVEDLPLSYWHYKEDLSQKSYLGPMAQDFGNVTYKSDAKTIEQIDMNGVLIATVKNLLRRVKELESR